MRPGARRWLAVLFVLQAVALLAAAPGGVEGARRLRNRRRPCPELYVVKAGETLQTISVKCNNIYILEDNSQINDTDDLGPGVVLFMRKTT